MTHIASKNIEQINQNDNWMDKANCKNNVDIMFPEDYAHKQTIRLAKALCSQCIVVNQCGEYALKSGEVHGIWGGMTPAERKRTKKQENYNQAVYLSGS